MPILQYLYSFFLILIVNQSFCSDTCIEPLKKVPYGEDIGLVLASKTILIQDATCPGNPSLIDIGQDQILLAYRDNRISTRVYDSFIGLTLLDKEFNQVRHSIFLPHTFQYMEDPRLFIYNNQLFLMHGHYICKNLQSDRTFFPILTPIDVETNSYQPQKLNTITIEGSLKQCTKEKNWTPFVYKDDANERLFFFQWFSPLTLLELMPNGTIVQIGKPDSTYTNALKNLWGKNWGELRGSSPAFLIGDEYITFFHSVFYHKNDPWYVFGALTFDARPPFSLRRVSKFPIITREMYKTPFSPHSLLCHEKRIHFNVVWPGGFIIKENNGKTVFYVACGENESTIKIISLDKDKLFENMQRIL